MGIILPPTTSLLDIIDKSKPKKPKRPELFICGPFPLPPPWFCAELRDSGFNVTPYTIIHSNMLRDMEVVGEKIRSKLYDFLMLYANWSEEEYGEKFLIHPMIRMFRTQFPNITTHFLFNDHASIFEFYRYAEQQRLSVEGVVSGVVKKKYLR